jgi:DNA-binding transcriptional regulator YdaS (Cro superfamily)
MNLKAYLDSLPDAASRERFAVRCETSLGHLRNVAAGKTCGEKLAINIERESAGAVSLEEMRDDVDWAYVRGTAKAAA